MRIPRKNSDTLIVLGGKSGAFWFGFYVALGAVSAGLVMLLVNRWARLSVEWVAAWWGA